MSMARGMGREYGRVLVDQGERAAENRGCGAAILFEDDQPCTGEVVTKQFEGCARSAAKTVNRLVGIAHGEDVSFRAGEASQNLDLGEVGVLEFIRQNEARPGARLVQTFVVVLQQIVGPDDHVAERPEILFPQPALQCGKYAGDFAAAAEHFGLLQDVL